MQSSSRLLAIAVIFIVQLAICNAVPAAKRETDICAPLSKGAGTDLYPSSGTLWASFVGKGVQIYDCPSGTLNSAKASIYIGCPGSASHAGRHNFKSGDPHFYFTAKGQTKEFQGTVVQRENSNTGVANAVLQSVNLHPDDGDVVAVLRSNTIGGNFDAKACKPGQSQAKIPYQAEYRVFIK